MLIVILLLVTLAEAQQPPSQASPAAQAPPRPGAAQTYPPEQVRAGAPLFAAQCGFCHGRDATGGQTGPDLTRSALVAEDVRGDKIGPVVLPCEWPKKVEAMPLSASLLTCWYSSVSPRTPVL